MFDYDDYSDYNYDIHMQHKGPGPCTKEEVKWGRRFVMDWSDIEDTAKIFPQHTDEAYELITKHLGYSPERLYAFRHEPFVRTLIEDHKKGLLDDATFQEAVKEQAKLIRNDEMQRGGWAAACTEHQYHCYFTHLTEFKDRARQRLMGTGIKEEPPLEYRIHSEMMLRAQFLEEDFIDTPGKYYTHVDKFALTIFFYKQALMEAGREVANSIDLMGV